MSELPFKVKALYEYKSPHDDDLNFGAGEIITVTEEEDTEWFYGHYVDSEGTAKEGIFPRNFVERYSPEAPPRPARAPRSRKEGPAEQPRPVEDVPNEPAVTTSGPQEVSSAPAPTQAAPKEPEQKLPPPVSKTQASSEAPSKSTITAKPQLSGRDAVSSTKPARSTADTEDKPAPSSFKDRIAAFNKPAAPPVAPVKPAALGGSTFVKKPFVPPPPSRDAYVPPPREPPQKIYVREEKETTPAAYQQLDAPARVSQSKDTVAEEAEAKPTSLKERIALLQKQQLENAMRHTEGSQKKETAKRPTPQRTDSVEDPGSTRVSTERTSMDPAPKAESPVEATHPTARDEGLARPPVKSTIRRPHLHAAANDFPSDSNDADQSGADEVTEDNSTEQETSDPVPQRAIGRPQAKADGESDGEEVKHEDEQGAGSAEEEAGAAGGDEDDAEIDPELKRRMELRERMAKMSGGMGMHGMFGVPAGLPRPPAPPRKAKPEPGAAPVAEEGSEGARGELASYAPPVQVLPLPIRTQEQRSETGASQPLIEAEEESATPLTAAKSPTVPDVGRDEDERGPPVPAHQKERTSMESGKRPSVSREDSFPTEGGARSRRGESVGISSPVLPPRMVPTQEPAVMSPSAGSESDDEMSMRQDSLPAKQESGTSHQRNPRGPPSHNVPAAPRFAPPVPGSSSDEPSFNGPELALDASTPTSPVNRRLDDPPPVPQSAVGGQGPMTSSTRARPPPPPPPAAARKSTGDTRPLAGLPTGRYDPNEEETAAYEGDYDTDIAPTATHKAALKSHTPEHGHGPTGEETSGTHASSPTSPVARAPPPLPRVPPPSDQPKRVSDDSGLPGSYMPRAAPPPIPAQTQGNVSDDDEYDPYRYDRTPEPMSRTTTNQAATGPPIPQLQQQEDDEVESPAGITPAVSPPHQPPPSRPAAEPPLKDETSQRQGSSQQGTLAPSQPHDASKRQSMVRRSTDQGRPSMDSDYIATDVDLGRGYQWWTEANRPPPVFQNRTDVMFEMEESQTSKRGGKTIMSKEVYVLFQDYSQTIITARYDAQDANDVSLEQRHEPPPPRMRQDQLEMSHTQFGRRLAEGATAKVNNVVGDGTPHALVHELLKPLAGALMPVGTRAYGAMIYLNLANASVQQHDEIRSGDIVSFRNARFQGHRGPMHQKYSIDVGKPDHVGIVVDWDGTKKKVRAWEQGREGKKVKVESFKLGDLRSGEVKIWRVVGRSWVKWEN